MEAVLTVTGLSRSEFPSAKRSIDQHGMALVVWLPVALATLLGQPKT